MNHVFVGPFPMDTTNRVRLWDYNGVMTKFECEPDFESVSAWANGSVLTVIDQQLGTQTIKLEVTYTWNPLMTTREKQSQSCVRGYRIGTRARISADMAQVEARMLGKFVLDIGDGYEYHCALTDKIESEWNGSVQCVRTYKLTAVKCGKLISLSKTFAKTGWSFTVDNPGNAPRSDVRLYVSYSTAADRRVYTIGENTYDTSYTSPDDDTSVLLDGIGKVLKLGSMNLASKITWEELPYLSPGQNLIREVDGLDLHWQHEVTVTVEWWPVYL